LKKKDKNPADPDAKHRFELLQLAKETLSDEKLRQKYNNWLNSGLCMPWKEWLRHSNNHQMVL
jgi:DnaJ-class molecular chaperone